MNDAVFAEKSREAFGSVYLNAYLEPFREWIEGDEVSEIIVNRPGEVWLEVAGEDTMRRVAAPAIDDTLLRRL